MPNRDKSKSPALLGLRGRGYGAQVEAGVGLGPGPEKGRLLLHEGEGTDSTANECCETKNNDARVNKISRNDGID